MKIQYQLNEKISILALEGNYRVINILPSHNTWYSLYFKVLKCSQIVSCFLTGEYVSYHAYSGFFFFTTWLTLSSTEKNWTPLSSDNCNG